MPVVVLVQVFVDDEIIHADDMVDKVDNEVVVLDSVFRLVGEPAALLVDCDGKLFAHLSALYLPEWDLSGRCGTTDILSPCPLRAGNCFCGLNHGSEFLLHFYIMLIDALYREQI